MRCFMTFYFDIILKVTDLQIVCSNKQQRNETTRRPDAFRIGVALNDGQLNIYWFITSRRPESPEFIASDAHVGVHLAQSVADGGEVAAQVLHHVLDAAGVFEQVDALRVRVVVHRERTLDRLGKLPVEEAGQKTGSQIRLWQAPLSVNS